MSRGPEIDNQLINKKISKNCYCRLQFKTRAVRTSCKPRIKCRPCDNCYLAFRVNWIPWAKATAMGHTRVVMCPFKEEEMKNYQQT